MLISENLAQVLSFALCSFSFGLFGIKILSVMKVLILLIGFIPNSFTHFFDIRNVPNQHIVKGFEYLNMENYSDAFTEFATASRLVNDDRERSLAAFGLGIASFYLRDTSFCFTNLQEALKLAATPSDSAQIISWLVYVYQEFGLSDKAVRTIQKFRDYLWLEDSKVLALAYLNAGMPDSALKYASGDSEDEIYIRGFAFFLMQRYDDARSEFQKIVDIGINSYLYPHAIYMIGECFYREGKVMDAAQTFEKLAYIYTGSPISEKAIYASAYAYYELGMYSKADSLLEALIEWYRPKGRLGVEVKLLRAVSIMRQAEKMAWDSPHRRKLIFKARKLLDDITDPPYDLEDDIVLEKARTHYALWEHDAALNLYLKGLDFGKSEHIYEFYFEGGRAAYYAGKYGTSIRLLSYVLEHEKYSFSSSYYIGVSLYALTGSGDTALPYLRYATASPKSRIKALAFKNIGDIFLAKEMTDSAIVAYQNAIRSNGLTASERDKTIYRLETLKFTRGDYPNYYEFAVSFVNNHGNNRFCINVLKDAFEAYKTDPTVVESLLMLSTRIAPTDTATLRMILESKPLLPAYKIADLADTVLHYASKHPKRCGADFFVRLGDIFDLVHVNNLADSSYRIALSMVDLESDPELTMQLYYMIARERWAMSDFEGASQAFRYAFEISTNYGIVPNYAYDLYSFYVWSLVRTGHHAEAESVAHQAVRLMPEGELRIKLINFYESIGISVMGESVTSSSEQASAFAEDSLRGLKFRGVQLPDSGRTSP